jgi:hypothetical protein
LSRGSLVTTIRAVDLTLSLSSGMVRTWSPLSTRPTSMPRRASQSASAPRENLSLNNRYRPDPHLSDIDALLILDDDLRIDCDSVQRALGAFHRSRRQDIVGWFPRFAMLGTPHSYYLGEPRTIKRGEYNLILSGAAFVDHRRYFELYWAPELAEMRAVVDVRSHLSDTFADSPLAHPLTHSFVRRSRSGTAMICCLILWSQQLAEGATTSGPAPSQTSLARLAWGSVMTRMACTEGHGLSPPIS